jgi:hypothetical protein
VYPKQSGHKPKAADDETENGEARPAAHSREKHDPEQQQDDRDNYNPRNLDGEFLLRDTRNKPEGAKAEHRGNEDQPRRPPSNPAGLQAILCTFKSHAAKCGKHFVYNSIDI